MCVREADKEQGSLESIRWLTRQGAVNGTWSFPSPALC